MRPVSLRFSLAQLLVVVTLVAILCSCSVTLGRIWSYTFPFNVHDVQISRDGATVGLALAGAGRSCVLLCNSRSGQCIRCVEIGGEPVQIRLSSDLTTWAAVCLDGRIEFGRVASGERWDARPSADILRRLTEHPGWARIVVSGNGAASALTCNGSEIAVLEVATGKQVQLLKAGGRQVMDVCLTADGKRVAASWRDGDSGITVWDVLTGRRAAVFPALAACPLAWAGDDAIVSVEECPARRYRRGRYSGPGPSAFQVAVRTLSSGQTRSVVPADLGYGRVVTDGEGAVMAITVCSESGVVVIDAAKLEPRYSPSATVSEPEGIQFLAISDGGATAVVACGDIGPFRQPVRPASIFVIDMKNGVMHALQPDRHSVAKSIAVVIFGGLAIGFCLWLLWRTAPRREPNANSANTLQVIGEAG